MNSNGLVPHAVCWAASPRLIWTMVVANSVIFLSYASNCGTLLFIAKRTFRAMLRDWVWFVVGFAIFIVACGSTHLMDVITTWIPVFWIDAWATIITAAASALVAIMLIRRASSISFAINDYARRLSETEQERQNLRDRLLAARKVEDWSRMSAAITHEISNPLEAIQNVLHLIQKDPGLSPETLKLAEMGRDEIQRVITISHATLAFHRETRSPERVNLRSVADSVLFLLRGVILDRSIHFEVTSEGDLEVEAFPGETRQVILNLARNACEATTEPGRVVRLHLDGTAQGVQLTVTDQGHGISPERVASLFEFGHSTKGEQGNGMGLWTVRQIVLRHGGTIRLDTSYREGARFIVWWPKQYRPAADFDPVADSAVALRA